MSTPSSRFRRPLIGLLCLITLVVGLPAARAQIMDPVITPLDTEVVVDIFGTVAAVGLPELERVDIHTFSHETGRWAHVQTLTAPAGTEGFGAAVGIGPRGNLSVGAPDTNANAGTVVMYQGGPGDYSIAASDLHGDPGDRFGQALTVVSTNWGHIFVGAPGDDDGGAEGGAVHEVDYDYGPRSHVIVRSLYGSAGDEFGFSMPTRRAGNDYLAAGAPGFAGGAGTVRTYRSDNGEILFRTSYDDEIAALGLQPGDRLGERVVGQGMEFVLGVAPGRDDGTVISLNTERRQELQQLAPTTDAGSGWGSEVDLNGDFAIVGDAAGVTHLYSALDDDRYAQTPEPGFVEHARLADRGPGVAHRLAGGAVHTITAQLVDGTPASVVDATFIDPHPGRLVPEMATPGAQFGSAVAMEGDTAIVAGNRANGNAGGVRVFRRIDGLWTHHQVLPLPSGSVQAGDDVALFGNTLIVDTANSFLLFERSDENSPFVFLGSRYAEVRAMATDGETLVTQTYDGVGVFTGGPSGWLANEPQTLDGPARFSYFGSSLAVQGDDLFIGEASYHDGPGKVHFLRRAATDQPFEFLPNGPVFSPNSSDRDIFGGSMAISGDRLAIGARFSRVPAAGNVGAVYITERDGNGGWTPFVTLVSENYNGLGFLVDIDGGIIASRSDQGTATFALRRGGWIETPVLTPVDAEYREDRTAIDLSGTSVIFGSEREDFAGLYAGSAIVQDIEVPPLPGSILYERNSGSVSSRDAASLHRVDPDLSDAGPVEPVDAPAYSGRSSFGPDARFVITEAAADGGDDGNLYLRHWDPAEDEWTNLGLPEHRMSHPAVSPDGTTVLFSSDRTGTHRLYTAAVRELLRTPGPSSWTSVGGVAPATAPIPSSWSADGERIVVAQGGNILVVNTVTGQSSPFRVGTGAQVSPKWAPGDGDERVAYVDGTDVVIASLDGSSPDRVLPIDGVQPELGWSPDGAGIAYAATVEDNTDIFTVELSSELVTRLTTDPAVDHRPTWGDNPSDEAGLSGLIAFIADRDGDGVSEGIYTMRSNGTAETLVVDLPGVVADPELAPDGTGMLFRRTDGPGDELWYSDLTGAIAPLARAADRDIGPGRISPDGARVAFGGHPHSAGKSEVFVADMAALLAAPSDQSAWRRVARDYGMEGLAWSPDSTRLAAIANSALAVIDVAAGSSREVVPKLTYEGGSGSRGGSVDVDWSPAPNSDLVAFELRENIAGNYEHQTWLVNVDAPAGNERRLGDVLVEEFQPRFSPSGETLLVASDRFARRLNGDTDGTGDELTYVDVDTGVRKALGTTTGVGVERDASFAGLVTIDLPVSAPSSPSQVAAGFLTVNSDTSYDPDVQQIGKLQLATIAGLPKLQLATIAGLPKLQLATIAGLPKLQLATIAGLPKLQLATIAGLPKLQLATIAGLPKLQLATIAGLPRTKLGSADLGHIRRALGDQPQLRASLDGVSVASLQIVDEAALDAILDAFPGRQSYEVSLAEVLLDDDAAAAWQGVEDNEFSPRGTLLGRVPLTWTMLGWDTSVGDFAVPAGDPYYEDSGAPIDVCGRFEAVTESSGDCGSSVLGARGDELSVAELFLMGFPLDDAASPLPFIGWRYGDVDIATGASGEERATLLDLPLASNRLVREAETGTTIDVTVLDWAAMPTVDLADLEGRSIGRCDIVRCNVEPLDSHGQPAWKTFADVAAFRDGDGYDGFKRDGRDSRTATFADLGTGADTIASLADITLLELFVTMFEAEDELFAQLDPTDAASGFSQYASEDDLQSIGIDVVIPAGVTTGEGLTISAELPSGAVITEVEVSTRVGASDCTPTEADLTFEFPIDDLDPMRLDISCPDLRPTVGEHYRVDLRVLPGLDIGALDVVGIARTGTYVERSDSDLNIVDPFEVGNTAASAVLLDIPVLDFDAPADEEGLIVAGHLEHRADQDFYAVDLDKNEKIEVVVNNKGSKVDTDIVAYAPPSVARVRPHALDPEVAAAPGFGGDGLDATLSREQITPESYEDLPLLTDRGIVDISDNRDRTVADPEGLGREIRVPSNERVQFVAPDAGRYLFQVTSPVGSVEDDSSVYALQFRRTAPAALTCPALPLPDGEARHTLLTRPDGLDRVRSLIVVDSGRTAMLHGDTEEAALWSSLEAFAAAPAVEGVIVDVAAHLPTQLAAVAASASPCDADLVNGWVRSINDLLDEIDAGTHDTDTHDDGDVGTLSTEPIAHYTLVGSELEVPSALLPDVSQYSNEAWFSSELLTVTSGSDNVWAARGAVIPTDSPYGVVSPVPYLDRDLYLPERALVGRILETPAEIRSTIDRFIETDGVLDHRVEEDGTLATLSTIAGSDFLNDTTLALASEADRRDGDASPTVRTDLDGETWSPDDVADDLANADDGLGIVSLLGHADWAGILAPSGDDGDNEISAPELESSMAALHAALFSIGCHFGLSVPDALAGADAALARDFSQITDTLTIAPTTYGLGSESGLLYSEYQAVLFARALSDHPDLPLAAGLLTANIEYLLNTGLVNGYDYKVLHSMAVHGPTQYRLLAGDPSVVGDLPRVASGDPSALEAAARFGTDVASQPIVVDGTGRTEQVTDDGTLSVGSGGDTSSEPSLPVLSAETVRLTIRDNAATGVFIESLTAGPVSGPVDPVFAAPDAVGEVSVAVEPQPGDVFSPSRPVVLTGTADQQRAVFATQQAQTIGRTPDGRSLATIRPIDRVTATAYYSTAATDTIDPTIRALDVDVVDGNLDLVLQTSDEDRNRRGDIVPGAVVRARAQVLLADQWTAVELAPSGNGRFTGSLASVGDAEFSLALCVADLGGRTTCTFTKGADFGGEITDEEAEEQADARTRPFPTPIVASAQDLGTGWYRSATVSFDETHYDVEIASDGGDFVEYEVPVVYIDDRVHTLEWRAVERTSGQILAGDVLTVSIDNAVPTVDFDALPTVDDDRDDIRWSVDDAGGVLSASCSIDGSTAQPCRSGFSVADVGPGTHTFDLAITDLAGNQNTVSHSWARDRTAPVISITGGPAEISSSDEASFDFTATDEGGSAQVSFECTYGTGTSVACSSPHRLQAFPDGDHLFTVDAVDGAGNVAVPATHAWTIDTKAPSLTIVSAPDPLVADRTASFEFATDDGAGVGVASTTCSVDAGAGFDCADGASLIELGDGEHELVVTAVDRAGNATTAEHRWVVDATAPTVSLDDAPPAAHGSSASTFAFSATDAGPGEVTFRCQLDAGTPVPCSSPLTYEQMPDGAYVFSLVGVDAAGNVSESVTHEWAVDTTDPALRHDSVPPEHHNSRTATFEFSASDEGPGDVTFTCMLDQEDAAPCSSPHTIEDLIDGEHDFTIVATDAVGNASAPLTYVWQVDATSPTITIHDGPNQPTTRRSAEFEFTVDDPGDDPSGLVAVLCRVDGGSFHNCSSPQSYENMDEGNHVFTVRVLDRSSNLTEATYEWRIELLNRDAITNDARDLVFGD